MADPLSDRQRDAIRRLRVIDGALAVRLGVDVLVLVHAVLLGARSVVDASRGLPRAKASYWRIAFRFALDEIGALAGLTTDRPKRPPVPERFALQAAVIVTVVRKGALWSLLREGACASGGGGQRGGRKQKFDTFRQGRRCTRKCSISVVELPKLVEFLDPTRAVT